MKKKSQLQNVGIPLKTNELVSFHYIDFDWVLNLKKLLKFNLEVNKLKVEVGICF